MLFRRAFDEAQLEAQNVTYSRHQLHPRVDTFLCQMPITSLQAATMIKRCIYSNNERF
jgi:hypothetical protein